MRWVEAGRWREAGVAAAEVAGAPGYSADARALLGRALWGAGMADAALGQWELAVEQRPGEAHPALDMLPLLEREGREAEIPALLLAVLARRPGSPLVALTLARHYRALNRPREALPLALHARRLRPDWAEAARLLGWVYGDLGDLEESAAQSRAAVGLDPLDAAAWSNLGVALTDLGRHAEGEAAHEEALRLAPGAPRVRVNRAVNLLCQGRLAEAWADYEWRLEFPGHSGLSRARLLPDLDQRVDLRGKTVLLTHEEGLGDTIQFARFAPLLAARGARVLAHAPVALERLLRSLPGGITVVPGAAAVPEFDYHCPYSSLPRAFGVSLETIPPAPYLFAEAGLIEAWRGRLRWGQGLRGLRAGLVWAGQARPWVEGFGPLDGRRSMRLGDLRPLAAVPGVEWVSLQKGIEARQLGEAGFPALDPMDEVADFADTAAIVAQLDVVVSVDTSVAHLAGAMGKRVLLLDRYDTCWRWLRGREDSPWYENLRIFRQERVGDWAGPVERVGAVLAGMAQNS